jgi:hypothetical protein
MSDHIPPTADDNVIPPVEPSARRGRGRPRKDAGQATNAAPGETKPPGADTEKPRRRKKGNATNDEILARAQILAGIHATIAMFSGIPEMMLQENEAMSLATASLNFESEFGFEINTKAVTAVALIGTMGRVYIPKVMQVKQRMEMQRRQAEAEEQAGNKQPDSSFHETPPAPLRNAA